MTEPEFDEFTGYLTELWPKLELTLSQREAWRGVFIHKTYQDARAAVYFEYQRSKTAYPRLGSFHDRLSQITKTNVTPHSSISPEFVDQVHREEAEEAAAIADWTDEERENGRKEIIRREPPMKELLAKAPLRSTMLTHFLVERYVHQRMFIFPNGKPVQVSIEEAWQ